MRHATQIPSSKFQVPTIDIVSLQSANPDSVSLMPTAQLVESISGDPGAVVPVLVQQSATPPPLPSPPLPRSPFFSSPPVPWRALLGITGPRSPLHWHSLGLESGRLTLAASSIAPSIATPTSLSHGQTDGLVPAPLPPPSLCCHHLLLPRLHFALCVHSQDSYSLTPPPPPPPLSCVRSPGLSLLPEECIADHSAHVED